MRHVPGSIRYLAQHCLLPAAVAIVLAAPTAVAHPPAQLSAGQEKGTVEEVKAFRKDVAAAIAARDGKKLRKLYDEGFRHIHPDGRIDGQAAHIAALLQSATGIETVPATELQIRIPGGWTAIVTARSIFTDGVDGKPRDIRWMAVFVRAGDGWQIAASHATRIIGPSP